MIASILTSIKKLLGIEEEYEHFDVDIIMHINSVFMILNDLGVGPAEGFSIQDKTKTWTNYLGADLKLEAVKTYVYLKVRLIFDPPLNAFVVESMNKQITEFEWRLNARVMEAPVTIVENDGEDGDCN